MVTKYIPLKGQFIWIDFDPQAGREQAGRRPGLVVSNTQFNSYRKLIFVCPITNTIRRNPFYVVIPEGELVTGAVMCDQLKVVDYRARNAELIGECPPVLLQTVLRRINRILN